MFSGVWFYYNHPVAFIIVDDIVLHGDGRHHIQLISKVLHTYTKQKQYSHLITKSGVGQHSTEIAYSYIKPQKALSSCTTFTYF